MLLEDVSQEQDLILRPMPLLAKTTKKQVKKKQ